MGSDEGLGDRQPEVIRQDLIGQFPGDMTQYLSLTMIVRNEESNLPECLTTAADLVDEVVIADTGSADRTREIAHRFGARVVEFPWADNFAAARNAALQNATGDWVWWLDADDRLDAANQFVRFLLGDFFLLIVGIHHQHTPSVRSQQDFCILHRGRGERSGLERFCSLPGRDERTHGAFPPGQWSPNLQDNAPTYHYNRGCWFRNLLPFV